MVEFTLTDEQKSLREMAHDFAVKEIRPVAWEYDRDGTWPQEIIEKAWEVGLMNSHISEEYGGAGAGFLDGCLIEEELSWGCSGHPDLARLQRPGHHADPDRRLRGGQAQVPGDAHRSPQARLLLPDRARRRLRRLRDAHDRRAPGRQVRAQRLQVLHHQRRLRRLLHRLREDRQGRRPPRHLGVRGRARLGRGRGQEGGQARAARLQHRHDLLQRRRGPGREPARRGEQGLQARDDDPRPHPSRGGRDGHRDRPRGLRVRHRLRPRTRPVRRADRDAPGDPVHDRRHGHRNRGGPPADVEVGRDARRRASATRWSPRTPSASPPTPR